MTSIWRSTGWIPKPGQSSSSTLNLATTSRRRQLARSIPSSDTLFTSSRCLGSSNHAPSILSSPTPRQVRNLNTISDVNPPASPYGPQKGDHVTIALSGGVDSSVTALLLAQSCLYSLSAVFMRNWNELDESGSLQPGSGGASGCSWQKDWEDVQSVCRHLGNIPVQMIDLSKEYWTQVFEPALDDWREGTTPNPDVGCNREIKFGALMDRVLPFGKGNWLATGHYADIRWSQEGRPKLMRAKDRTKDQTYYLSSVSEARLAHAHFPLANLLKSEVRDLARRYQLPTASRKESMGICFIGTRGSDGKSVSNTQGFSSFLNGYITSNPGEIVDGDTGETVGKHSGLHTLTVGQGARIRGASSKYYVARKDVERNKIVVVQGKGHPMLMCTRLHVSGVDWIWNEPPPELKEGGEGEGEVKLLAQVRHRQMETECVVRKREGGGYEVEFEEPVLAVAPGQVLGLWRGNWCLGSAVIEGVETLYDEQQRNSSQ